MKSQLPSNPHLILASTSPRRLELLSGLGIPFEVIPSDVDETVADGLAPEELVQNLACLKAEHVAKWKLNGHLKEACLVLGADTIVVLEGQILGKPHTKPEAQKMLKMLSGKCHTVYTGVAVFQTESQKQLVEYQTSSVYIRALADREIESYVETGEPLDKAGAYALQGTGSAFVEKIKGCFTNVIGLPMPLTVKLLRQCGLSIMGLP